MLLNHKRVLQLTTVTAAKEVFVYTRVQLFIF